MKRYEEKPFKVSKKTRNCTIKVKHRQSFEYFDVLMGVIMI